MKKFCFYSTLSLSAFMLLSCSQMKRHMKKQPSDEMSSLMQSVEVKPKKGEYTHELAEANADDLEIKKEVGETELDEELPGSESDDVPYSRPFLAKKKTKRMQFWVDYFTQKQRDRFQRFLNNGEEYRHHIENVLVEYGLPKELYFVGLIESGYYLGARSHASAVGPWQFIKATGRRYNMKVTHELDERQDLFKSTHAAARYFKDLHNMFSSWELALAAYNAGENGMLRRILKHGTRDFYALSRRKLLPAETINYVPKVLAAMHVWNNAEKYGFEIPKKKHRLFDLTELAPMKKNVPLRTVASRLNIDVALLKKLNPELKRGATPRHFAGTYYLRIPNNGYAYKLKDIEANPERKIAATPTNRFARPESRKEVTRRTASNLIHKVKKGETIMSLARKYETTPRAIAAANKMKTWRTELRVGQRLQIGSNEEQVVSIQQASAKVRLYNKPIVYKVSRGDNLSDIAKLFNSSLSKIKRVNNLKRGKIMVGQKLVLPGTTKGIYTVKRGDHLTKVARDLNQPMEALVKLNSLKKRTIYPGQKIIVNMD